MADTPFDVDKAHRWFAIECNNSGWDIIESPNASDADLAKVVHIAHASAYHWMHAGDELNEQRAMGLVVFAYLRTGGDPTPYARRAAQLLEIVGDRASAFDRATTWLQVVAIERLAGDDATEALAEALRWADQLGENERPVYDGMAAIAGL